MQFFSRKHLRNIFTKPTNYINTNRGDEYYKALYEKMRKRLDDLKGMEPVRESYVKFEKMLDMWELSRRDFLKWVSATTALLMLPPTFEPLVAEAAEVMNRVPVIWINI